MIMWHLRATVTSNSARACRSRVHQIASCTHAIHQQPVRRSYQPTRSLASATAALDQQPQIVTPTPQPPPSTSFRIPRPISAATDPLPPLPLLNLSTFPTHASVRSSGAPSPFQPVNAHCTWRIYSSRDIEHALTGAKFLVKKERPSVGELGDQVLGEYVKKMWSALDRSDTTRVFQEYEALRKDRRVKSLHVEVFNILLRTCGKLKQADAAVATFDAIFQHQLRPNFFSYIHIIEALFESHLQLPFDFLVLLHREFEFAIQDSRYEDVDPDCEFFMHQRLLQVHTVFLQKTGYTMPGYHETKTFSGLPRFYEKFLKSYMWTMIDHLKYEMGVKVVQRRADSESPTSTDATTETTTEPQHRPMDLSKSSSARAAARQAKRREKSASYTLTQADVDELYPRWQTIQETLHSLFASACQRHDWNRAEDIWKELQQFRSHAWLRPLLEREWTVPELSWQVERYVDLLCPLSKIHYPLDQFPACDKPHYFDRRLDFDPNRVPLPLKEWHHIRETLYEEYWLFMRGLIKAQMKVQQDSTPNAIHIDEANQILRDTAKQIETLQRRSKKLGAASYPDELDADDTSILPISQYVLFTHSHRREGPDPDELVKPFHSEGFGQTERDTMAEKVRQSQSHHQQSNFPHVKHAELHSIESLVDSLYEQNLALKREKASSESSLQQIEGVSASELESQLATKVHLKYSEEPEDVSRQHFLEEGLDDEEDEIRVRNAGDEEHGAVLSSSLEHGMTEAHRRQESLLRKMPPPAKKRRVIKQESPLTSTQSNVASLLPPHLSKSVFTPAMQARLSHLYETLLANHLLYGAAAQNGHVMPGSYRRNQEIIHALYYDYLDLDLPSPDTRIFILAHLSYAPPEFHTKLIAESDWAAPRGLNGLVPNLFFKHLIAPPPDGRFVITNLSEAQMQKFQWFQRLWYAHHVHEWSANSRGSDHAFRKRTYRLMEELFRRGLSPQSARDGLLHFIIRCLSFTSYASRPDGNELMKEPFEWRRENLYVQDLLHIRKVLRVLFSLILNHGVTVDVKTMNELISACLSHHSLIEAHALVQHMRYTFHLQPDIHTMNLFLSHKMTSNNSTAAQRMLIQIDQCMEEMISTTGYQSKTELRKLLPDMDKVDGDDLERRTGPQTQLVQSFNQQLNQYLMAGDSGRGMYKIHERMFHLGLTPNSRTLALSLDILLAIPNIGSFGRARELFDHAISQSAQPLDPNGPLQQFVQQMEQTQTRQKQIDAAYREEIELERKELAASSTATSSTRSSASHSSSIVSDDAVFDPLNSPTQSNVAIPFSYESWFNIYVTSKSWLVLLEGAEGLGSWGQQYDNNIDSWSLFRRYMVHLIELPRTDRRTKLHLNETRQAMFGCVLRTLIKHTDHLAPQEQLWYFKTCYDFMTLFFRLSAIRTTDGQTGKSSGSRVQVYYFQLDDGDFHYSFLDLDFAALKKLESQAAKALRLTPPVDEDVDLLDRVMNELHQRGRHQKVQVERTAETILQPTTPSTHEKTMTFL